MKDIKITIDIKSCDFSELSESDRHLVDAAKRATDNSYSPYSKFAVGAALRLDDGTVVTGANQENAAFPSGTCAERAAVFAAQSQHPKCAIVALAVAARNSNGFLSEPITPCGACRQVLLGIEDRYHKPMRVLLYGVNRVFILESAAHLMPLAFVDASMD